MAPVDVKSHVLVRSNNTRWEWSDDARKMENTSLAHPEHPEHSYQNIHTQKANYIHNVGMDNYKEMPHMDFDFSPVGHVTPAEIILISKYHISE